MQLAAFQISSGDPLNSSGIYWDLRKRLISQQFKPREKLKPDSLRQDYNCSASTMREVLFRLSCDRFVEFEDQKGFRVPAASIKTLRELTHLRVMLEQEGASKSIARGGLEWEADLTAAHHKLAHIEGKASQLYDITPLVQMCCDCEFAFHAALLAACGSAELQLLHHEIYDRHRLQVMLSIGNFGFRLGNIEEHRAILDAALNRDAKTCTDLIKKHLNIKLEGTPALEW